MTNDKGLGIIPIWVCDGISERYHNILANYKRASSVYAKGIRSLKVSGI